MNQPFVLLIIIGALVVLILVSFKSTPQQSVTVVPTVNLTPTSTPTPLNSFKYPNSTQISNGVELILQSFDNPQTITDWYKNIITGNGLKTTSFIQTNTNGEILNKLVGANNNSEVRVEISKQANQAVVTIKVTTNG